VAASAAGLPDPSIGTVLRSSASAVTAAAGARKRRPRSRNLHRASRALIPPVWLGPGCGGAEGWARWRRGGGASARGAAVGGAGFVGRRRPGSSRTGAQLLLPRRCGDRQPVFGGTNIMTALASDTAACRKACRCGTGSLPLLPGLFRDRHVGCRPRAGQL